MKHLPWKNSLAFIHNPNPHIVTLMYEKSEREALSFFDWWHTFAYYTFFYLDYFYECDSRVNRECGWLTCVNEWVTYKQSISSSPFLAFTVEKILFKIAFMAGQAIQIQRNISVQQKLQQEQQVIMKKREEGR